MAFKHESDDGSHSVNAGQNKTAGVTSFTRRMTARRGRSFDDAVWPGCGETALPGVIWESVMWHTLLK